MFQGMMVASGGGGGNEDGYMFTFGVGELVGVGNSNNPIVFNGDFSDIKTIQTLGTYYASNLPSQNALTSNIVQNISVSSSGTSLDLEIASSTSSGMKSYRHIIIYPNKLEIWEGYYGNHNDDISHAYGGLQILTLSKSGLYL